jgi:hypothetical protein
MSCRLPDAALFIAMSFAQTTLNQQDQNCRARERVRRKITSESVSARF